MCNDACIAFGERQLTADEVRGKDILEVGAVDVNGSLRRSIAVLGPASYVGTDIHPGPGVDEVCEVGELASRYGDERFDVVICTEVLEHIEDWRRAVANMKAVLRPAGLLLVTTRSRGFPYHGYPYDFWRYEIGDFRQIFGDLEIVALESDPTAPGVLLAARKPRPFVPRDLEGQELYSIVSGEKCRRIAPVDILLLRLRHTVRNLASALVPRPAKKALRRLYPGISTLWRE